MQKDEPPSGRQKTGTDAGGRREQAGSSSAKDSRSASTPMPVSFYREGNRCGASVGRGACEAMKPFRRRGEDEHAVASRGADRFGVQEPPERFGGCDFACARRHGLIGDAGHDAEDGVVGR